MTLVTREGVRGLGPCSSVSNFPEVYGTGSVRKRRWRGRLFTHLVRMTEGTLMPTYFRLGEEDGSWSSLTPERRRVLHGLLGPILGPIRDANRVEKVVVRKRRCKTLEFPGRRPSLPFCSSVCPEGRFVDRTPNRLLHP